HLTDWQVFDIADALFACELAWGKQLIFHSNPGGPNTHPARNQNEKLCELPSGHVFSFEPLDREIDFPSRLWRYRIFFHREPQSTTRVVLPLGIMMWTFVRIS